jgi:hypothetical protein
MTQGIMTRILVFALLLLLSGPELLAQGSTGGTLGKTDQSLSGGTKAPQKLDRTVPEKLDSTHPSKQSDKGPSRCAAVGTWTGEFGEEMTLTSNGTSSHSVLGAGTWSCNNRQVVVVWKNGLSERCSPSTDGQGLACTGSSGWNSNKRSKAN